MAFSWAHGITGQPVKSNHVGEEIYINQPLAEQLRPNGIHRLRVGQQNSLLDLYWRRSVPGFMFLVLTYSGKYAG